MDYQMRPFRRKQTLKAIMNPALRHILNELLMAAMEEEMHLVNEDDTISAMAAGRRRIRNSEPAVDWEPFFLTADGLAEADQDLRICGVCRQDFICDDIVLDLPCCKLRKRLHVDCAREALRANHQCPFCRSANIEFNDPKRSRYESES